MPCGKIGYSNSVHELMAQVLSARPEPIDTFRAWWERHRSIAGRYDEPIQAAIACAAGTDRLAWAFGSGYQCAVRALVPGIAVHRLGALSATEAGGAHPRAITTTVDLEGHVTGSKTFITFGMEAEELVVIASEGTDEVTGMNRLRAVLLNRDAPGVSLERLPDMPFVPEISHASLTLDRATGALLEGDGYLDYLKPFRTIEDTHVLAAAAAHMVTLRNAADLSEQLAERAVAALSALVQIARMPPLDPATHLALAGVLEIARALAAELDAHADEHPALASWKRDHQLLSVAGKARAKRREAAWSALGPRY